MTSKRYIYIGAIIIVIIMTVLLVWFLCFSGSYDALPVTPGPKIIIDHDGGADDSMAIFVSLLFEQYFNGPQILGITTTHGNVDEPQAFNNTQRILDVAGRHDVPIYRGSNFSLVEAIPTDHYFGLDGLGDTAYVAKLAAEAQAEVAAVALVELTKKYPDEITVVAIGAMTNIALAIRLDPGFTGRLSRLYVGAGNIYSEDNPAPEFNAEMDAEAYHIVTQVATPDKVTVIPFTQIRKSLNISKDWRENILGAVPTDIMRAQNSFERISFATSKTWSLLDPAVMSIVLDNNIANEIKLSDNSIILCGAERAINTNKFNSTTPNVELVYSADINQYKDFLLNVFSAELNSFV